MNQRAKTDAVQAVPCISEVFFPPKLYAHSVPILNFSQVEPYKARQGQEELKRMLDTLFLAALQPVSILIN